MKKEQLKQELTQSIMNLNVGDEIKIRKYKNVARTVKNIAHVLELAFENAEKMTTATKEEKERFINSSVVDKYLDFLVDLNGAAESMLEAVGEIVDISERNLENNTRVNTWFLSMKKKYRFKKAMEAIHNISF